MNIWWEVLRRVCSTIITRDSVCVIAVTTPYGHGGYYIDINYVLVAYHSYIDSILWSPLTL